MKKISWVLLGLIIFAVIISAVFVTLAFVLPPDDALGSGLALGIFVILVMLSIIFYFIYLSNRKFSKKINTRIFDISLEKILIFAKIGILIIDKEKRIVWSNEYIRDLFVQKFLGKKIENIIDDYSTVFEKTNSIDNKRIKNYIFDIQIFPNSGLILFQNTTVQNNYKRKVYGDNLAVGIVSVDNFEQTLNSVGADQAFDIKTKTYNFMNDWYKKNKILFIELKEGYFFVITTRERLLTNASENFGILKLFEQFSLKLQQPIFLSMGFGYGYSNAVELYNLAVKNLKLSQQRGGNQVVMTEYETDNQDFLGGITESSSSTSRIEIRAFSNRILKKIRKTKNVLISGHQIADFDCLAAQLGMYFIVKAFDKNVKIVLDFETIDKSTRENMYKILPKQILREAYINSNQALRFASKKTLSIVVDTNFPDRIQCPELNNIVEETIVIDHHRATGKTFKKVVDSYVNSGASSTAEIVTEIIEYTDLERKIPKFVFNLLLTGIVMDTNSFRVRTTGRTFDACAKLQDLGASMQTADEFLKATFEEFVLQSDLIKNFEIVNKNTAISVNTKDHAAPKSIIARAAEELIKLKDIESSFVIAYDSGGKLAMSCRSTGKTNVQTIAEKLGGGGHFTASAVEKENTKPEELYKSLIALLRKEGSE